MLGLCTEPLAASSWSPLRRVQHREAAERARCACSAQCKRARAVRQAYGQASGRARAGC